VGSCVLQCTVNWCNGRGDLLCISVYSELVDVGICCVSQCTVNWCNRRGELLCRTGDEKVRRRLEIDILLIWNDITV